jgi:hypothetical protein
MSRTDITPVSPGVDDKNDVVHHEVPPPSAEFAASATVSPFQHLGIFDTLKTFRKASILCILTGFNACSDGYQLTMPGNVIAMPGGLVSLGRLVALVISNTWFRV